jgi:hypothetical protein
MPLKMCSHAKRKEAESRETGTCVARGEAYMVCESCFVPSADVIGRLVDQIGPRKLRGLRTRVCSSWLDEALVPGLLRVIRSLHVHLVVVVVGRARVSVLQLFSVPVFALLFSRGCDLPTGC